MEVHRYGFHRVPVSGPTDMKLKPQGTTMSPRCITMVLEIFLELPATVMVTMSELQANRLLIPHPHDFRRTPLFVQVEVTSRT